MLTIINLMTSLFITHAPIEDVEKQEDNDWGWFIDIDEKHTPSWHKYTGGY